MPYVTDGEGMHHFRDPADGEVYASAYLGMDVAHNVFPCFDQNDLKAPVALQVSAPEHWTVVSNSRVSSRTAGRWRVRDQPAAARRDVRGLRRAVGVGHLGARRACRSAGTPGPRCGRSSSAMPTSCAG